MSITVIYGAPATGKTTYAQRLSQHYCCSRIVDSWEPRQGGQRPCSGDLVLTTAGPDEIRQHLPGARLIWIPVALRAIGVKPKGMVRS
jgi:hypothetical protein